MPVYVPAAGVTVKVSLDDMPALGSPAPGTYTTDISNYCHLGSGLTITRGRQDEFGAIDPTQVTLGRVDDDDGSLTLQGGRPIRITYTVGGTDYVRATGFVETRASSWVSPTGSFASSTVTAVDALARLSRRLLRSVVESEIMYRQPITYYTLGEPTGSTSAGDSSGYGQVPLAVAGTGAAVGFGSGAGPGTDGLTAATFAGGQYLRSSSAVRLPDGYPGDAASNGAEAICFFSVPTPPTSPVPLLSALGVTVGIDTTGRLCFLTPDGPTGPSSNPVVTGGSTHYLNLYRHSSGPPFFGGFGLGQDYTLSGPGLSVDPGPSFGTVTVGGPGFVGTVSHVAVFNGLGSFSDTFVPDSAFNGFAGETADQRVIRLARYADIVSPLAYSVEASTVVLDAARDLSGRSVKDAFDEVTTTEGGALFIDGTGKLTFHNRQHAFAASMAAAEVALGPGDIEHDDFVIAVGDKQYLRNRVKGTRPNGAAQEVTDPTSLAQHEEYPVDLGTLLLTTDTAVLDVLNWNLSTYDQPLDRISSVSIDMLTMPTTIQQVLLGLDIGDRLTVSGLPTNSPIGTTADLLVEGLSESLTLDSWRLTFNTVPAALFHVWRLEDATYGQLGTTTRLAY